MSRVLSPASWQSMDPESVETGCIVGLGICCGSFGSRSVYHDMTDTASFGLAGGWIDQRMVEGIRHDMTFLLLGAERRGEARRGKARQGKVRPGRRTSLSPRET
jgi:hypothetical protein